MAQISFIKLSDVVANNRFDAEYYRPEILDRQDVLAHKNNDRLGNLVHFVVGPFGSTVTVDNYVDDSNYRYVRNKDINDFIIKDEDPALIPEDVWTSLPRFHIQENDLLITVVGTLGKVAIATAENLKSIFSCKSTILRSTKINPFYLLVYLNSNTGKLFSLRGKRGAIQEGLNLTDLKNIQVFVPSTIFQSNIEQKIRQYFTLRRQAKTLYTEAEKLILGEIGLTNWQPKHQLVFTKKYSDTQQAERIDADYFQPKYEEIEETIKKYKGGYSLIGQEFQLNDSTFAINKNATYQYVEIGSVNVSNGEIVPVEMLGSDLPANAKRVLKKNDVLVSKVRTYRGAIAIVEKDGYVGSGAFAILEESQRINKETLLVFLHSKPLLAWSLKPNTGAAYPVITDDDILKLPIPILPQDKQTAIEQKVRDAIEARNRSKHLLSCATRAVEMAIEQDEQTALNWLKREVPELTG